MKVHIPMDVSALSHVPQDCHAIQWRTGERNVKGMQIRIAKATREGKWRKVKALQRRLTRTLSAKLLAVRRVTENQGKRTAGVDGELWKSPETKWSAINRMNQRGYSPSALRRVYIPKANGKKRPLGITGWHDHHIEYRVHGGSDALGNRVLLHPNCHAQVHSKDLKVVKPASL